MNHIASKAMGILLKGAVVSALFFASAIHAGSLDANGNGTRGYGQAPADADRSRSVQGLGSNDAFERRTFRSKAPATARVDESKKVYLEDYQRVPQAVGRKHPTQPHVLGQGNRRQ